MNKAIITNESKEQKMFETILDRTKTTGLPREDYFLLKALVDKSKPMKVVDGKCNNCNNEVSLYVNYCDDCGQNLRSDSNE
jgi:hypothetical protein